MFANIFGNYLVRKKIISEDEFVRIKMTLYKTRVKLGLIAVSEGLITEKQADEVNRKQQVMDRKFGDIAISLGYLTPVQVERLLALQGNQKRTVATAASRHLRKVLRHVSCEGRSLCANPAESRVAVNLATREAP